MFKVMLIYIIFLVGNGMHTYICHIMSLQYMSSFSTSWYQIDFIMLFTICQLNSDPRQKDTSLMTSSIVSRIYLSWVLSFWILLKLLSMWVWLDKIIEFELEFNIKNKIYFFNKLYWTLSSRVYSARIIIEFFWAQTFIKQN